MSPHITPLTVSHFNMHLNLKSARLIAVCKCTLKQSHGLVHRHLGPPQEPVNAGCFGIAHITKISIPHLQQTLIYYDEYYNSVYIYLL